MAPKNRIHRECAWIRPASIPRCDAAFSWQHGFRSVAGLSEALRVAIMNSESSPLDFK